jgi:microcystin-dependent protein
MTTPFIGQIMLFGGNFAPLNWALCNGQLIAISQNTALFSILGTQYGGDGVTTFALPDLRGRVPIHWGQGAGLSNYVIGQRAGNETTTILTSNMPAHNHGLKETDAKLLLGARKDAPNSSDPAAGFLGGANIYVSGQTTPNAGLAQASVAFGANAATELTGSSTPINNIQPYQCVTFVIALFGVFPSRN